MSKFLELLGGRKCFQVTMYSVVLEGILIVASVVLAFMGKLTDLWVEIFKFHSGAAAVLVTAYVTGNVIQKKIQKK